ncbi:Pyruvate decarboxylase [Lachancea thermotolerans]
MSSITLGRYLFERLRQVECFTIFGLPGDFNLRLLDEIYEGIACLITTFGVGELSALNGVAGSYAEHVGVLHVVGVPSLASQAKQLLLHHTLDDGDFAVFHRTSANISETTAMVTDLATAPQEIDRCIRTTYVTQRPVYLGLPANIVNQMVDRRLLDTPIDLSLEPNDEDTEEEVLTQVLALVQKAQNPIILADACCSRHDAKKEAWQLTDATQFPCFVTPMGKGSVPEKHPRFGCVYVGTLSSPDVKSAVEAADLILSLGALLSDFNTGSFSYSYGTRNVVEFHSTIPSPRPVPTRPARNAPTPRDTPLTQEWLWTQIGEFLREGDVVVTETGTSAFGINQTRFPNNTYGISQVLWGSIGFTTGATLGAAMAAEELDKNRRVILFIGGGSLQLTVQEISSMVQWGLRPYLFVLNNDGYTIEKLIHGPTAQYNEIQNWHHLRLLPTFGATDYEAVRVATTGEWDALTNDPAFNRNSRIRLVEVMLEVMDAPSSLVRQAQLTAATNAQN